MGGNAIDLDICRPINQMDPMPVETATSSIFVSRAFVCRRFSVENGTSHMRESAQFTGKQLINNLTPSKASPSYGES